MSRQAFEAWCKDHHAVDWAIDLAWLAWQAATDAERLAQSLSECSNRLTLRVSCADAPHQVLMQWNDAESGWRDARGEPA